MSELSNINPNNKFVFVLSNGEIVESFTPEELELINQAPIRIKGENNSVKIKVKDRSSIVEFLNRKAFSLMLFGYDNMVEVGIVNTYNNPLLGLTGLNICLGNDNDPYIEPDIMRGVKNCKISIGDNTIFCGARLFLQDDNSSITIGKDCMFSWGIDVWCTDVHTITDMEGNPLNYGKSIEIGDHVWVGRDVKIGKNTKISNNSIVGWASVVTKKFHEPHVIVAGNPAKVVKTDIDWDPRDLQTYNLKR